jgi:hypothetical protein
VRIRAWWRPLPSKSVRARNTNSGDTQHECPRLDARMHVSRTGPVSAWRAGSERGAANAPRDERAAPDALARRGCSEPLGFEPGALDGQSR